MRNLLLLACLALAGCGDYTGTTYDSNGDVDVRVVIRGAMPEVAAKRLRDLALSLDGGAK